MDVVGQAVTGAGKGAVALGLKEVGRFLAAMTGSALLRKVAGSTPVTALLFAGVEQTWLTWRYQRRKVDRRRYVLGTVRNVGSSIGSILGALIMGVFLSVVPVLGTVIGLMIGSFLGSAIVGYGLMGIMAIVWLPKDGGPLFGHAEPVTLPKATWGR